MLIINQPTMKKLNLCDGQVRTFDELSSCSGVLEQQLVWIPKTLMIMNMMANIILIIVNKWKSLWLWWQWWQSLIDGNRCDCYDSWQWRQLLWLVWQTLRLSIYNRWQLFWRIIPSPGIICSFCPIPRCGWKTYIPEENNMNYLFR